MAELTVVTDGGEVPELLTSADVMYAAGITYRQLDFWTRTGRLKPERKWRGRMTGSGSPRTWSRAEMDVARNMGRLIRAGLPLETAHRIARSGEARTEVTRGVWLELGPPLSRSCERDDHGTCFRDEPADCGCACHDGGAEAQAS